MSIDAMRRSYDQGQLDESQALPDAIAMFEQWFEQALSIANSMPSQAGFEPNVMTLATATPQGKPSARVLLLKGISQEGLVFYTNHASRKGDELKANPYAAMTFHWAPLERQVRVEGKVQMLSREQAEQYFHSRPTGSQIAAAVSDQSKVIASRKILEDKQAKLEKQYEDQQVPMPEDWGGYCLVPNHMEFWQGRVNRLHDRLLYTRQAQGNWQIQRLSP